MNLDTLLCANLSRTLDNSGCFSLFGEKFQVIADNIVPKTKITVLMSKKIGINVLYHEKLYEVLNCNELPTGNTTKELHKAFKTKNRQILILQYTY